MSVFELGCVEISVEVRSTVVSDPKSGNTAELFEINKASFRKIVESFSGTGVGGKPKLIGHLGSPSDWPFAISDITKNIFVRHGGSPPAHCSNRGAAWTYYKGIDNGLYNTGSPYLLSELQTTKWLGFVAVGNDCQAWSEAAMKSLRAGDATPSPVVANSMNTNDPRALKRPQDDHDGTPTTHFDARDVLQGRYDDALVSQLGGDDV